MVDKFRFGSHEKLLDEDGRLFLTKMRAIFLITGLFFLAAAVSRCLVNTIAISGDERISVVAGFFGCLYLFLWIRALIRINKKNSLRIREIRSTSTLFALGCTSAIICFWLAALTFDIFPANPPTVGLVAVVWSVFGGILASRSPRLKRMFIS